jgi:hypothetical protein
METKALGCAIKNQQQKIHNMKERLDTSQQYHKLTRYQCKKQYKHYLKKLNFFKCQQSTKWVNWPNKKKSNKQKNIQKEKDRIQKEAKELIDSKDVIVLTKDLVPDEAIVVLGKGLGFVKTPNTNLEMLRLDARLVTNRIALASQQTQGDQPSIPTVDSKSKYAALHIKNYHAPKATTDPITNIAIERIEQSMNHVKPTKYSCKSNLTSLELKGYHWLKKKTSNLEIVVCEADKGGAKLIVPPELIEKKIIEKVENPNLYTSTDTDPRPELYNELINIWTTGKIKKFVTEQMAQKVVGLTSNNNKSTSSHFTPGIPYFNPNLKIHKIENLDQLKPGVDPPARIITALQDGVTKRSDVYLADTVLKTLELNFCKDLLRDTTDSLIWLDNINNTEDPTLKKTLKCFTFDFKNLYDSISPTLAIEAIKFALDTCRPQWKQDYKDWILSLIKLSLKASIGKYKGKWFKPVNGIPTGGSISVQVANITVFYVLFHCLYSKNNLMENVYSIKRFIDDGAGIFQGSQRQFQSWKNNLTGALREYHLTIEDSAWQYAENGDLVHFLDIKFGFDYNGDVITDLYRKETDARSYLHFSSCHPNHIFSSIVYSQGIRIRRIVNDNYRLSQHLDELKIAFFKAKYPKKMVNNIIDKVKTLPRILQRRQPKPINDDNKIRVVSTFGADQPLTDILNTNSLILSSSKIFSKTKTDQPFQFIKKVAPSLKSTLVNSFRICVGSRFGKTTPCGKARCQSCKLVSNKKYVVLNNNKFLTAPGNCNSSIINYACICKYPSCSKPYIGKTVQPFNERINGHRNDYKKYCKKQGDIGGSVDLDRYAIGIHLYREHGLRDPELFNLYTEFSILENCSPKTLSNKEHLWIQKARSMFPEGLNLKSPYGLPLLSS